MSYQQGAKLEYERAFDEHWRINPDFDTLTFFFAEEDLTRVAMLRAGEADIAEIPRELQGEIVDAGYAITQSTLPAFMVWIGIGGQYLEDRYDPNDPNTNVLVRRAMNHAINRDALNEAFFDNKMELMANTGWHPTDPSYDPAWQIPEYNPELSRELLAEAGYAEGAGPSIEFMAGKLVGVPELTEIAVPMISWLEDVGFTVDAQIGEFQPIRTRYKAREMNGVLWDPPHRILAGGPQHARVLRQSRPGRRGVYVRRPLHRRPVQQVAEQRGRRGTAEPDEGSRPVHVRAKRHDTAGIPVRRIWHQPRGHCRVLGEQQLLRRHEGPRVHQGSAQVEQSS